MGYSLTLFQNGYMLCDSIMPSYRAQLELQNAV